MTIYFNDYNEACFNSRRGPRAMFKREIAELQAKLKELPIDVELVTTDLPPYYYTLVVQFKNQADAAYFKILTNDGIEIQRYTS
jgi:hypothetical protein